MPSSALHLIRSAGLNLGSSVPWGDRPALDAPGVYLVSTSPDPAALIDPEPSRVSREAIEQLLAVRPGLTVHGVVADADSVAAALMAMWPPNETVLYIGLAGTSVAHRVGKYYATAIGARAPHAGGWPVKMVADLDRLHVHVAAASDPDGAEEAALRAFMAGVDDIARAALSDPSLPLPFANLQLNSGVRKRHGIRGAKEPRVAPQTRTTPVPPDTVERIPPMPQEVSISGYTLKVTANDIAAGQIRITRDPKRALALPVVKTTVSLVLRGEAMTVPWDPRMGPDQERSGLLRIGKSAGQRLLGQPTTLAIGRSEAGLLDLR